MQTSVQHTTMICLFHDSDQAYAAVEDLVQLGIPRNLIGVMANSGTAAANPVAMEKWKVPAQDAQLLTDGINNGGVVIAVSATDELADKVEEIYTRHKAGKVDETEAAVSSARPAVANSVTPAATGGKINVVEEELVVGKRQVELGGVRVYSRVTEKPVSASVNLREEHIAVERHAVNRPLTEADGAAFSDRTLEVTELGEEAVVAKTARVVEEVVIGKEETVRQEVVKDTVRRTDVEVEQTPAGTKTPRRN